MKKWIKIAGLLLLSLPVAVRAADFTYTTNNKTITITKYIGTNITVAIPDTINGLPVTSIGSNAFRRCFRLTSITIPESVTCIRGEAFFACAGLTSITIPNSVTHIGERAFWFCIKLNAITVDDRNSVYSSTNGVLFDKNQTVLILCPRGKAGSYAIPDSVTNIGQGAFSDCGLTSITIPRSVASIGKWAFSGCTNLTSVTIPNSVTNIGEGAFLDCKNLNTITVDDRNSGYSSTNGVLFDKNQATLIQCPGGKAGNYTIPNSVAYIGDGAFCFCTNLTSVTIPNSVIHIGEVAFWYCRGLTSVTIPNSVTNIGEGAFWDCTSLDTITVDDLNCAYSSTNGVLYDKNQTTLIHCLPGKAGSYTIPDSVTCIKGMAFYFCTNLTSVTIPNSVTNIEDEAFLRCTGLNSITVDDRNPVYSSTDGVLYDKNQTVLIRCPGKKAGSCTIPNSVTYIGDQAFRRCTGLTSITIPDSVTKIGEGGVFLGCTNLTSITIPDSVTSIGKSAFGQCAGLTNVTIAAGIASIGESAFSQCTGLASITIPNSVTSIGEGAFCFCTNLTEVYFRGNAPDFDGADVFRDDDKAIIYRTAGTTGWPPVPEPWAGRPTALWDPSANENPVSWKQRFFGGLTNYWPISLL